VGKRMSWLKDPSVLTGRLLVDAGGCWVRLACSDSESENRVVE
jgi:hypothetical protein